MSAIDPISAAKQVLTTVLERLLVQGEQLVLVDSPPGAGKTRLVEDVTLAAVTELGLRVGVVAPRAEQTYDIARRLLRLQGDQSLQLLHAERRELPFDLISNPRLTTATQVQGLALGPSVVIGTVMKFFMSMFAFGDEFFDVLICDEAYQLSWADYAPLFSIAKQHLLVGDPGQLPPLVTADIQLFEASEYKVHRALPKEILRTRPDTITLKFPVSRRLRQDTVEIIQPSFYPQLPFISAAGEFERNLQFGQLGLLGAIDRILDMAEANETIVGLLLPRTDMPIADVDQELCDTTAAVVRRILQRRPSWGLNRLITERDIGCIDAHVASVAATQRSIRQLGVSTDELMVNTPEIWQGLERPLTIVKHPLSGVTKADSFSLEPGRWSVMLTRHQLACIIVSRDGVGEMLESHSHNCADRSLGADNLEWQGWNSHSVLWRKLEELGRLVRLED